jgi:arylsulfatase A-like enzyme
MTRFILAFLAVAVCFTLSACQRVQSAETPNIIYILADDAGYGDFGCYRQDALPTPNIDRMAREGIRFTQHYAGCTVCAPSRCVLLTGLHSGHCRVRGNSPGVLTDQDVTIAQHMKKLRYATGCIGKWGVGAPPPLNDPQLRGFDYFYGYISMWHAHNFYPEFLIRNGEKAPLRNVVADRWKTGDGRGVATKRVDYAPDLLSKDVLRFVEEHREGPFFLYYALNIPHANNEGGRFSDFDDKGMEVPDFGPYVDKDWPAPEKGFAAIMRNIDLDVGRILSKLKELGIDEKTIVMFSSDNGPHQEGGHQMEFFNSNGDLRGMKRDLYEGGIRVPLVVRWPGTIAPNTTSDLLTGFQDILPTCLEIAGESAPEGLDGFSFLPTLQGQDAPQKKHEFLYWEFTEQGGKRAVRKGDWKLVQLQVSGKGKLSTELFHLKDDPKEEHNIAATHPDVTNRLLKLMDSAHSRNAGYPLFASERNAKPQSDK